MSNFVCLVEVGSVKLRKNRGFLWDIVFIALSSFGANRQVFKMDELGFEIAQIAFPAALALTADPIASLIDTAFIGQIGTNLPRLCFQLSNLL